MKNILYTIILSFLFSFSVFAKSGFDQFESGNVEYSMKCYDQHQGVIRTWEKIGKNMHVFAGNVDGGNVEIAKFDDKNRRYILEVNSLVGAIVILVDYKNKRVTQKNRDDG